MGQLYFIVNLSRNSVKIMKQNGFVIFIKATGKQVAFK